jgi:hypothetical protein
MLDERCAPDGRTPPSVHSMEEPKTFAVTLVRTGPALPYFEVGAYRYTGPWLPFVGDIITITPASSTEADAAQERLAYVTRVDPSSETPIRVTEARTATVVSPDDFIVAA